MFIFLFIIAIFSFYSELIINRTIFTLGSIYFYIFLHIFTSNSGKHFKRKLMASLIIGRKTEILDTLTSSQQMLHYL